MIMAATPGAIEMDYDFVQKVEDGAVSISTPRTAEPRFTEREKTRGLGALPGMCWSRRAAFTTRPSGGARQGHQAPGKREVLPVVWVRATPALGAEYLFRYAARSGFQDLTSFRLELDDHAGASAVGHYYAAPGDSARSEGSERLER